jgi:hypothetical protein
MSVTLIFESADLYVDGKPVHGNTEIILSKTSTRINGFVGLSELTDIAIVSNFLAGRLSINGEDVL